MKIVDLLSDEGGGTVEIIQPFRSRIRNGRRKHAGVRIFVVHCFEVKDLCKDLSCYIVSC